jgi:hypothetical protein
MPKASESAACSGFRCSFCGQTVNAENERMRCPISSLGAFNRDQLGCVSQRKNLAEYDCGK